MTDRSTPMAALAPPPVAPLPEGAARRAVDALLLDWVAAALAGETRTPPRLDAAAWDDLVAQLRIHRLVGLIWPVVSASAGAMSAPALARLAAFRDLATRMNGANLMTMRRVLPAFAAAGLPVVAFKGPLIQQAAYGGLFIRPSSDIDLLVHPRDFDRAAALLDAEGYSLAPRCRSLWWRLFLGERHFLPRRPAEATIDLHLRLQQPGAPLPRLAAAFLEAREESVVGGAPLPVLSARHQLLLCAMSFVKALHHREPALRYVVDYAALAARLDPAADQALEAEAARQGLRASLALTRRAAALLTLTPTPTPSASPSEDPPTAPAWLSDADLRALILRPDAPDARWPRRRRLLWALSDRPGEALGGVAFMAAGEVARRLLHRRPGGAR